MSYTTIPASSSGASPGTVIDGTGLSTTVPWTVKNGKSQSGYVAQVTSTFDTGYILSNSAGTMKGAFGIAAASDGWITGTVTSDIILGVASGNKLHLGVIGASAPTLTVSTVYVGVNNTAPTLDVAIGTDVANPYAYDHGIAISTPATSGHYAGIFLGQSATKGVTFHWLSGGAGTGSGSIETYLRAYAFSIHASVLTLQGTNDQYLPCIIGNVGDNNSKLLVARGSVAYTAGNVQIIGATGTFSPTSGTAVHTGFNLAYTINQTGGANGTTTGLFVNATETAVVGAHNLFDFQIAGTSLLALDNSGGLTMKSSALATNATTGFLVIRTMAGTPSGAAPNGSFVFDTSGLKIWMRTGAAWKQSVALT